MTQMPNISVLFDDIGDNMLKFFAGWDTHIPHQGEKGGIRERRVQDFLRNHLPRKYGVASGHIIDRNKKISLQEDIIIYDRLNAPILKIDDYYQVFPCETVFATVEVKSTLDKKQIANCIEHTVQLRDLDRRDLGPIESFVFAYDSYDPKDKDLPAPVWAAGNFKAIASSNDEQKPMPSIILSLKKRFMLYFGIDEDLHLAQEVESGILLFFLTYLLHRLANVKTSTPLLWNEYGASTLTHYGYELKIGDKEYKKF